MERTNNYLHLLNCTLSFDGHKLEKHVILVFSFTVNCD